MAKNTTTMWTMVSRPKTVISVGRLQLCTSVPMDTGMVNVDWTEVRIISLEALRPAHRGRPAVSAVSAVDFNFLRSLNFLPLWHWFRSVEFPRSVSIWPTTYAQAVIFSTFVLIRVWTRRWRVIRSGRAAAAPCLGVPLPRQSSRYHHSGSEEKDRDWLITTRYPAGAALRRGKKSCSASFVRRRFAWAKNKFASFFVAALASLPGSFLADEAK